LTSTQWSAVSAIAAFDRLNSPAINGPFERLAVDHKFLASTDVTLTGFAKPHVQCQAEPT